MELFRGRGQERGSAPGKMNSTPKSGGATNRHIPEAEGRPERTCWSNRKVQEIRETLGLDHRDVETEEELRQDYEVTGSLGEGEYRKF